MQKLMWEVYDEIEAQNQHNHHTVFMEFQNLRMHLDIEKMKREALEKENESLQEQLLAARVEIEEQRFMKEAIGHQLSKSMEEKKSIQPKNIGVTDKLKSFKIVNKLDLEDEYLE